MAKRKKTGPEEALIESVTHDGRGVAAVSGKKVFVRGALQGEKIVFQRRKRHRNYDEAELVEVLEASPARLQARCAVFGICGGCSLQHVSQHDQREIKMQALADSLQRIGHVGPDTWLGPLYDEAADGGWHYRRRARLAVRDVPAKGRVLVGFREGHVPLVCDMHRCEVLSRPAHALIDPLSELIGRLGIRSRVPQVEVAVADNVTELVMRVLDFPSAEDRAAIAEFAAQHGVQISLQTGGPDSVLPLENAQPAQPLRYRLPEFAVDIEFKATDFVQVNGVVNELMVTRAIELLDVKREHRVLDLYCGIGNFSLPLARRAGHVLGVEGEADQVARARSNAVANNITNCEFLQADLAAVAGNERWLTAGWDRILLDPARSGAREVVERIETTGVSRIVYVSCHPATLARDAGILVHDKQFRLEAAGIIDMFPHTGHVESLAVFQKD